MNLANRSSTEESSGNTASRWQFWKARRTPKWRCSVSWMLKDSLFTGVRAVVKMEHRPPSASQRAASTLPVTGEHTAEVREARRACPGHPSSGERGLGDCLSPGAATVHGVDLRSVLKPPTSPSRLAPILSRVRPGIMRGGRGGGLGA